MPSRFRSGLGAVACAAALLVTQGAAGSRAHETPQVPNLAPHAPFDLRIDKADFQPGLAPGTPALRFSVAIANRGQYAFDLLGVADGGSANGSPTASALQCSAWAAPKVCSEREQVGQFEWHAIHGHYHLRDVALYELRRLTPSGTPDMTEAGLAASGGKVSFCLLDSEPEPGAERGPTDWFGNPMYTACFLGTQGISTGWADIYDHYLAGQQIILPADLPAGDYAVVVTIDPTERFLQTTRADDLSFATVHLSAGGATLS